MDLTDENKKHIDGLSYQALLSRLRFAPAGDPWFQGETGNYWMRRMREMRSAPGGDDEHVRASKSLGR